MPGKLSARPSESQWAGLNMHANLAVYHAHCSFTVWACMSAATVTSIVYHGKSQLYTSDTVAMVIYHTSCPVGPRYDKSYSYLHLGV